MSKVVAGAIVSPGECGEDDITSANLEQMAATLAMRPPTDADRQELVEMLRWLAKVVREMEARSSDSPSVSGLRPDTDVAEEPEGARQP